MTLNSWSTYLYLPCPDQLIFLIHNTQVIMTLGRVKSRSRLTDNMIPPFLLNTTMCSLSLQNNLWVHMLLHCGIYIHLSCVMLLSMPSMSYSVLRPYASLQRKIKHFAYSSLEMCEYMNEWERRRKSKGRKKKKKNKGKNSWNKGTAFGVMETFLWNEHE